MQDVQGLLERLQAEKQEAADRLERAIKDVIAVERVLVLLQADTEHDVGDTTATIVGPTHGATTPADVMQCRTQMDAAEKMAKANGGTLHITPASKVIKSAGLSEAKTSSIASTLHNRVSTSDDWEYVEPGTFRLVDTKQSKETPELSTSQMAIAIIEDDERWRNLHSNSVA